MMVPLLLLLFVSPAWSTLREAPRNASVLIGQDVTFRCTTHKSSDALIYSQWKSNTGSLLGYHQGGQLSGHQGRYTYIKELPEELHLKIEKASLEDDGQFECQVLHPDDGPIRGAAFLNIIVPPKTISFANYQAGTSIEINEGTPLNISCVIPNVKPAPVITWYINGIQSDNNLQNLEIANENKTVNAYSNLIFHPRRSDNNKMVICEAYHKESDTKLRTNTTLNVLYPPEEPTVRVLGGDSFVRAGDNISILCTVTGGNPSPNVSWFLGDKLIDSKFSFDTRSEESKNIYSFIAGPTDNLASYECRTHNRLGMEPLSKEVKINVAYGPTGVELFGETNIRQGASTSIQCRSLPSNPASQISWLINGHPVPTTTQNEYSKEHGKISISNITINSNDVAAGNHQINVECIARNVEGSSSKQHIIKILAPPLTPRLSGLEESYYFEGTVVNVTCEAFGGNPLAELTWYRGFEKINGAKNEVAGDTSVSTLSLRLDRTMNTQRLKCEASNAALDEPLVESRQLNVLYAPRRVVVRPAEVSGHHLLAGKTAKLLCAAPSSNPAAQLTWHFHPDGETNPLVYTGDTTLNETTRDGGYAVENVVSFVPTEAHDGTLVKCIASHPSWKHSINTSYPLNVLYAPRMLVDNPVTIVVTEGDSFRENLTMKGNPTVSSWQWRKNGVPFDHTVGKVLARGATLSGKLIKSTDAGTYTMIATNSVGNTNITVQLVVEYGARIVSVSSPIIASEGDTVLLECEADGQPKKADMVGWYRNDIELEAVHRGDTRVVLRLNASQKTAGEYVCKADNGVGMTAEAKSYILVNRAPKVLKLPSLVKAAGSLGGSARARCRVQAVPTAEFFWFRGSEVIKGNNSKYSIVTEQVDYLTFESRLIIKNLSPEDYNKEIRCSAKNNLGSDYVNIPIGPLTPPESPLSIRLVNSTANTISIAWEPGFDGGSDQIFEVKYQKLNEEFVHLVNTTFTNVRLVGLAPAKAYEFQVRAINARGFSSEYTLPPSIFATLNENGMDVAIAGAKKIDWKQLLPTLLCIGVFLILANICLLLYLCNRQRKKKLREKTEMVRTAINGDGVRPVQMYGTMAQLDGRTRPDLDDVPDVSEDDHSVRTMIEVSPNGYMQPIDPSVYERSCLVEYEFDPRNYPNSRHGTMGRVANSTYTNVPYPEPPGSYTAERSLPRNWARDQPPQNLSTFIHPNGVRAGPIHYSQLDGDLV